ncbi:FAD/NAD(P)-binding protein [Leucobacter denitrificans]|uniref:FAD/NAD(P)-binding protein n=1 Tax=Leucobacter denitrificans TaxID=683042 RepID=A0A7G9S349_9MICO|nr:FAD/NAD(P)-binding protein [Leucobacter denitrificans]QNN62274.1 FAD/NAD(P)-binding protein [Leucobacter denitrificans]
MTHLQPSIAIVGAGPRGASLLERISAYLGADQAPSGPLTIHVIDDKESGAGAVWATDQTREMCMNTLSDAVTLFTEPSSTVAGPIIEGPTLYEWSLLALWDLVSAESGAHVHVLEERISAIPESRSATYREFPAREGFAVSFREELLATVPESHPSRALYGEYLRWNYDRAIASLPGDVAVIRHEARAISIRREGDLERITLSDGAQVSAHSVILATGWLPRGNTVPESRLAHQLEDRPDLVWVRPASPIDQDLSEIAAGTDVIVRGLGMGFFDTMALLTAERGGRFVVDPHAPGGLRYEASGNEPRLHVTSRRGIPFRAKTLYGSLPPRSEQRYLRSVDWTREPRPLDFDRQFWPRIIADAMFDYASTLSRVRPDALVDHSALVRALEAKLDEILARPHATDTTEVAREFEDAVAPYFVDTADRFEIARELDPANRSFSDADDFQRWIAARVTEDLTEGTLGRDSALKAGLWSISSARGFTSRTGTFGGFDAESRASGFAELFRIGGMVGSGPPAFRNQQLLALMEAGLVRFIGPSGQVTVTEEGFTAESHSVPGSRVSGTGLIDAWMHSADVTATTDPLTRELVDSGRARPFTVASRTGDADLAYISRSFDIDAATGLLIGESGELDPAIHAAGIPVDDTVHDTIIGPMPGTDPTMLRETDRVAASALRVALVGAQHPASVDALVH